MLEFWPSRRSHGGAVVTQSTPTSEVWSSNPMWKSCLLMVGSLYSTEPRPTVCTGFLCPQNYPLWYDLYSVDSDVNNRINKQTQCKYLNRYVTSAWRLFNLQSNAESYGRILIKFIKKYDEWHKFTVIRTVLWLQEMLNRLLFIIALLSTIGVVGPWRRDALSACSC